MGLWKIHDIPTEKKDVVPMEKNSIFIGDVAVAVRKMML